MTNLKQNETNLTKKFSILSLKREIKKNICVVCKKEYEYRNYKAKFCSNTCRQKDKNNKYSIEKITESLNDKQIEAITEQAQEMLIIAGAGSGKTTVLTKRIRWVLKKYNVKNDEILAVTFTKKAATEIKKRLYLYNVNDEDLWIGTFHSICYRLLKTHYKQAGLNENFSIINNEDKIIEIKKIIKELKAKYELEEIISYIDKIKEKGINKIYEVVIKDKLEIYKKYNEYCTKNNVLELQDLLYKAYELLNNNKELLNFYQQKFKHILIDEYQDINKIQYEWIKLLKTQNNYIYAVGDDDQLIYSWRGSNIKNIKNFRKDYKNHKIIYLEQNYRSTMQILEAANKVIKNNQERLNKNLWSNTQGKKIQIYKAKNQIDEARYIIINIKKWKREGGKYKDCAIIYRNNYAINVLREEIKTTDMPTTIDDVDDEEIKDQKNLSLNGKVEILTIHKAKGLEFKKVFIIGATEGTIPSSKSTNLEEERRLFYVAMTRAKEELTIIHAATIETPVSRLTRGEESRFIKEIPEELKEITEHKEIIEMRKYIEIN